MTDTNVLRMGTLPKDLSLDMVKENSRYGFVFLTEKDFQNYAQRHPDLKVTGWTSLKKVKEDADVLKVYAAEGDKEYKRTFFELHPMKPHENVKPWYRITGYAKLDDGNEDNTFVVLVSPLYLILLLLLLLLCGVLAFLPKGGTTEPEKPGLTFEEEHKIEEPEPGEAYTETIDIPGYGKMDLTEKKKEAQLINPEGNTVYFVYTLSENGTEVHKTDAILPGNSVMVDLWSKLDAGEHDITFAVETYDTETEESCNGTAQTVKVVVTK